MVVEVGFDRPQPVNALCHNDQPVPEGAGSAPRVALVTGSTVRVAEVAEALESAGFDVIGPTDPGQLNGGWWSSILPRSVACYVQLPADGETGGVDTFDRMRRFLADGLVARFDAAYAAAPFLRPDACVVLVAGNVPGDLSTQRDLLHVLARAISGVSVEGDVKAVVVGADRSAQEIAHIALLRGEDRGWLQSRVAALSTDLSYADWKRELLALIPG